MTVFSTKHAIAGTVRWTLGPRDAYGTPTLVLLDDWAAQNVASVTIPLLIGKEGAPKEGRVRFHKAVTHQLLGAFDEIEARGLGHLVKTWGGSFVPRMIRGSSKTPSNHSFATAIDINAAWNGLGRTPAPRGATGSVIDLVPIFQKWGFRWGGHFKRRDGMHFEIAQILPNRVAVAAATPARVQRSDDGQMLVFAGRPLDGARKIDGRWHGQLSDFADALGLVLMTDTDKTHAREHHVYAVPKKKAGGS